MRGATAGLSPREPQSFQSISTSTQTPRATTWNALKHGLYAEMILLPEEDAAEFQRERRALFHNYRPQTKDEADLVETMAEHRWVGRRYRPTQARFDGQAVTPAADAAGRVCEPIAHQRLHSGMDVTVQRKRVENMWHRVRTKLVEVQKLRRLGFVEGAAKLPPGCYMEVTGEVVQVIEAPRLPTRVCQVADVVPQAIIPIPEPQVETDSNEVTRSANRPNRFREEPKEMGAATGMDTAPGNGGGATQCVAAPCGFGGVDGREFGRGAYNGGCAHIG